VTAARSTYGGVASFVFASIGLAAGSVEESGLRWIRDGVDGT